MKKIQNMPLWLMKHGFWLSIIAQFVMAGKRKALQRCAPAKKSVINMI
jgi:hypothetical protein